MVGGGHVSMTNVTVTGNNAGAGGGGGMYVGQNGKATLLHVTVAGNTGPSISGPAISLATGAVPDDG